MLLIDTHCDTLYMRALEPNAIPSVTPAHLRAGGVSLQVCALFAGSEGPAGDPYGKAQAQLQAWHALLAEGLRAVDSPLDAVDGENAVMLSIEGGEIFEEDIARVQAFREAGVRLAALIPQQAHDQLDEALSRRGVPLTLSQIKPENLEELVEHLEDLTVDVDGTEGNKTKVRVFCE